MPKDQESLEESREIRAYLTSNYEDAFDMALTSPPFWDLEFYGDELGQLGKRKTFTDFMASLSQIFGNVYRSLKLGSFFAVEVNDLRRQGRRERKRREYYSQLCCKGYHWP